MAVEEALAAFLLADAGVAAKVSDRIRFGLAAEDDAAPLIVIQKASAAPDSHNGGPGLNRDLFQIDCYGDTYSDARLTGRAVAAALNGLSGTMDSVRVLYASLENDRDDFDQDARQHRVSMDFRIKTRS